MKLQIHSIRFDADVKLLDFIQKRVDKLETFYDRFIDGEIFLRVDKDSNRENKTVEIKLNIPGSQLFVKEKSDSFEAAVDKATEGLRKQILKTKEKQMAN